MNKVIILVCTLLLSGCYEAMPKDLVVKEVEACRKAGLTFRIVNGDFGTYRVDCVGEVGK